MFLQILLSLMVLAPLQADDPTAKYRQAAIQRWETAIQALEKLDQEQVDPDHAVLFIGSSSIRLWDDIESDMAPWPTIRRGYGGARYSDLAVYIDRLVKPHQFDAVAIFVGNDISGTDADKPPEEILRLVKYVVGRIHDHNATAAIFLIGITPTASRFHVWEEIKKVNSLLAEYCKSEQRLHFIDTADKYLDASGQPNAALFREDRLHQNREGYRIWSEIIKAEFTRVLKQPRS